MSVRVIDIQLDSAKKEAKASLFADARGEVSPNMEVEGLPAGYKLAQSSSIMTASAEIAFMQSNGQWNWV